MPVPQNTAFVVKNTTNDKSVTIKGKEIVSSLSISNAAAHSGFYPVQLQDLAPVVFEGTRMKQLARSFQKYRFKKAHLTVQANAPTTTTGGYVAGYTENPDQGFDDNAISQISTLSGAVSAPLWVDKRFQQNSGIRSGIISMQILSKLWTLSKACLCSNRFRRRQQRHL